MIEFDIQIYSIVLSALKENMIVSCWFDELFKFQVSLEFMCTFAFRVHVQGRSFGMWIRAFCL